MSRLAAVQKFVREVQVEARKVVWPERKETVQATLVVLVMVIFVALFLWLVDSLFSWLIKLVY